MLHFDRKAYIKCKYVHFEQQPWSSQAQTPCTPKGWLRRTLLYCRSHWESLYEYKQTSNTVQLHLLLLYLVKWKNQESEDVNAVTSHFLKLFWLKIFSICLELRISLRIFEKIRNCPNGMPRGLGEWKKMLRHCPFIQLCRDVLNFESLLCLISVLFAIAYLPS
jgi:hypothetical protein